MIQEGITLNNISKMIQEGTTLEKVDIKMIPILIDKHTNLSSLTSVIQSIKKGGGPTYTVHALRKARDILFDEFSGLRPDVKKYIILLYDGLSTDRHTAFTEAQLLHRSTMLTAVGIGNYVGYSELVNIASNEDHVFTYLHEEDVYNRLLDDTVDKDCTDCVLHSSVEIMIVFDAQVDDFMDRKHALGRIINSLTSFRFKENMTIGVVTDSSNPKFIFITCWSKIKLRTNLFLPHLRLTKLKLTIWRCIDYLTVSNQIGFQTVLVVQMMPEKLS